ncbi:hypothetical protein LTR08_000930 [Meristemomyces frigidus]|nr:hypothetical protein LTR08_000930 [Meristemomyces frigidus]
MGLGLFQSDYDYNIIFDLNDELELQFREIDHAVGGIVGVYTSVMLKSELEEGGSQLLRNVEFSHADVPEAKKKPNEIYYSVYANLCSHPKRVKNYLESSGMLSKVIIDRMARLSAPGSEKDDHRPGYVVVLLGACAMSLGCRLSDEFLEHLRANYANKTRVGLMRDAFTQMKKALFGPDGYKNGVPYDFGSKGFEATAHAGGPPLADRYLPSSGWFNVPSPSGQNPQELLAAYLANSGINNTFVTTEAHLMEKFEQLKGEDVSYGDDQCGNCGAKDGMGGKVLVFCGKCKGKKYCSRVCQKRNWSAHKAVCRVPVKDVPSTAAAAEDLASLMIAEEVD